MAVFVCKNCGYGAESWLGRCPNCSEWNSFVERDYDEDGSTKKTKEKVKKLELVPLSKIKSERNQRLKTGIYEFDRVLGGGIVPGAIVLLTGEPGIGKSTLLLQALSKVKTVYVSGEESAQQVADRAQRLKMNLNNILFSDTLQVEGIIEGLQDQVDNFQVLVIDSLQTVYSKNVDSQTGSINQLRESLGRLITFAKKARIAVFVVGHVTKEGEIAGPKTIEHMVDTVLSFEGEKVSNNRILRALKNRFGGVDEVGIFAMGDKGLSEVADPLAFLEDQNDSAAGKATVGVAEGSRALFFEIQTLASQTSLPVPRRVVRGVDYNKVLLLLAVVKKQLGLPLDNFDIYINVVGGVSVRSTAADLGIVAAIVSSIRNVPISNKSVFIGEVGLLGETRKVFFENKVAAEAKRLKFKQIFSSLNIKSVRDLRKTLF